MPSSENPQPVPLTFPALKSSSFTIGRLDKEQHQEAAKLIHLALSDWYLKHLNQAGRFGGEWAPFMLFPELYETLDPGCAVTAVAPEGMLLGVCFYHPRDTHISIGIVSTAPAAGGAGIAKAMVQEVLKLADEAKLPVRLVSSAMNLDSYSLYTRLGFVPCQLFQDLQFPPGKLPAAGNMEGIRIATADDVTEIADLEFALTGIRREKDWAFFIQNESGCWHTLVKQQTGGEICGVLSSIRSGGTQMLGPGVMSDEAGGLSLITAQLHHDAGVNPVFLVPAQATGLVGRLYASGARNVELHLSQTRGEYPQVLGVVMPTFMPETG